MPNYEEPLIESLDPTKGWGDGSDRFAVKHFYAEDVNDDIDFIIQGTQPTDDAIERYDKVKDFNNEIIQAYRNINNFTDAYGLKSEMILPESCFPFHPCELNEEGLLNRTSCRVVIEKIQRLYFSEESDQELLKNAIEV